MHGQALPDSGISHGEPVHWNTHPHAKAYSVDEQLHDVR